MKALSKRRFIQSCCFLIASGLSSTFTLLFSACRKKEKTAIPTGVSNDTEKKRLMTAKTAKINPDFEPAYLELHRSGELKERGETLWNVMKSCKLCPRKCGVNRLEGQKGFCQATAQLEISSYNAHFGEEAPLVGSGGSGTIFFTNCSLRCVFCINWQISQGGEGTKRSINELANMMLYLQKKGCHNINVVTPSHYSPHILLAIDIAAGKGLRLPIVYNTCGWERLEILKMLDGVVDIYLPDFKYSDSMMAAKYSSDADTYPDMAKASLLEMHRQVGVAKPAKDGLMYRGLMIRHLVMPNRVGGTKGVAEWIAGNLPKDTYVNIMSQYIPVYKASNYPAISRRITRKEYAESVKWARDAGLNNLEIQGFRFF